MAWPLAVLGAAALASVRVHAQTSGVVTPARSPRNASYTIQARLDPATRAITASEAIVWRNVTLRATSELRFHLYWNAWRDTRSTFLRERALVSGAPPPPESAFARLAVASLTIGEESATDLTSAIGFAAPDDGNADDRTVMVVPLPRPVAPGQSLQIHVKWTARVPQPFARTGVVGNFFFLAQWFPKLGVLQDEGWNCHQFHATTEFFSDFGVYDVSLTVPTGWIVGATGVERSRTDNGDSTTTHRFYQEDVHDFAWTTSPSLIERTAEFVPSGATAEPKAGAQPRVALRLLLQPEHAAQAERHFDAARTALERFSGWFGPYPYDHFTIVDPAFQSDADGMEYPTLITAGTSWLIPSALTASTPEEVTIHETGHQWFYGVVGSNEFEDAWMDEGINTYASVRAMLAGGTKSYYERRFFRGFVPWVFRNLELPRETFWDRLPGYRRAPKSDLPSMPAFRYSVADGRVVTYNKSALWLNTLERMLGWPVMQRVLATYYERWQFKHPGPADFFAIVNEVSGRDLTWFLDQVYRSSNVFDYAVDELKSARDGAVFRTELIVRRNGEAIAPVDVLVTFADGSQQRETWDGQARWRRYTFDRASRAMSAQVDPDRVLLLDVNYTNNSKTLEPQSARAATKWSLAWLIWLQDALLAWAALA
jgi:hypothetical protein